MISIAIKDTKEQYKDFINMFVIAERRNSRKAIGVLKKITDDNKLFIQGKYVSWIIDPSEITDFTARPERYKETTTDGGF